TRGKEQTGLWQVWRSVHARWCHTVTPASAMQRRVDAFGQIPMDTLDLHQLVDPRSFHAAQTAKCLQQRRTAMRAHAGYILEHTAITRLLAPLAVTADGKAMRLVAHGIDQMQGRRTGTGMQCTATVGQDQLFVT